MTETKTLSHISWTSISTFMQCGLKWKFHYLDRLEPEFISSALLFGQATHEAIGAYLQSRLNGDPLTAGNMTDVFRQVWQSHDGPEVKYGAKENEDSLLEKASGILSLFHNRYPEDTEIIAVEEPFEIDLKERLPEHCFDLPAFTGIIDSIQTVSGTPCLIDYKTAARKPNGDVNSAQLVAYSFGTEALGFDANSIDYRFEYLVKTKEPDLVSVPVTITDNERRRFLKTVTRLWTAIRAAAFYPNPSYLCGSCPYQIACKQW